MRLSSYKDTAQSNEKPREQSFTVDQISKHQYFKKDMGSTIGGGGGKTATARNGFGATLSMGETQMNNTNRYNPVKFLKDPKKMLSSENLNEVNGQINEDIGEEDGSTGGNTMKSPFFSVKEKSVPMPVQPQIPEKMTSIKNVYNTISRKVDPIKAQVLEGRSSYLDTIREESE